MHNVLKDLKTKIIFKKNRLLSKSVEWLTILVRSSKVINNKYLYFLNINLAKSLGFNDKLQKIILYEIFERYT